MAAINSFESTKNIAKHFAAMIITLVCLCVHSNVSAQEAQSVSGGKAPTTIQSYLANHAGSPLVRYYQEDPNDAIAASAMKMAIVLENPDASYLQKEDLVRLQKELDYKLLEIDAILRNVDNGMSMKRAKEMHYVKTSVHLKVANSDVDSKMKSDASEIPVFVIPSKN